MQPTEAIYEWIKNEYEGGLSQEDLAKKCHMSQSNLQRLLTRKRPVSGLRLETIEKMFPRMTFSLTGNVTGNGNVVNSHNNFLPGENGALDRVLAAFMGDTDIPDAAKVKLFNLIQKEKVR